MDFDDLVTALLHRGAAWGRLTASTSTIFMKVR